MVGRHSGYGPLHNISSALKGHAVLVIAVLAAAVTCIFVPPAAAYADYFDLNTLSRIPAVESALGSLVALSPLLVGAASCQVISNVPSAVLLSRFTTDYRHLLVAVNIGGLGTPVSSLASLITLGEFRHRQPGHTARYLGLFSLINFGYLAILIATSYLADLIF